MAADDVLADVPAFHSDAFVVYQGHHGDKGALLANLVLPGRAFTEKDGLYVNTDGRVQQTRAAVNAPDAAREDWKIIVALADRLGKSLPYKTHDQVRERLIDIAPHFAKVGNRVVPSFVSSAELRKAESLDKKEKFNKVLDNFFITDPITRASKTLAKATKSLKNASNSYL